MREKQTAQSGWSHYSFSFLFESQAKGVSAVSVWAAASRWRPCSASILCVTHFVSVPGALRLKSLDWRGRRVQAQYGKVSPTPEKSSRRPDFFQLLSVFPRSSAHIHLTLCQGHFVVKNLPSNTETAPSLQECTICFCDYCTEFSAIACCKV